MTRPYLEGGGAAQNLLNLARGLIQNGHKVTLAVSGGLWLPKAKEAGLSVYQVPLAPTTPLHLLLAARQIRKILRQEQIELIHNHHRFSGLAAHLAARNLNIPHVTTVHEYKTNLPRLTRLSMGDQIITFSPALRDHLINHYRLPAERIAVVTMGVEQFGKLSDENHVLKRPSIGCIARLSSEKGLNILLEALAHIIHSTNHKPHCYIVGDGPLLKQLLSQAARLNIKGSVTFLGWQEEIHDLIVQCDFLVLPSLQEGFGLVVLEGWAQERPTIGSRVGGISELIEDGENGVLVPPDDVMALAGAILHLLEHSTLARNMGKHGRLHSLPRFTIEKMIHETEAIYAGLTKE
jgi:glycosyltransferase involved in cell wall biosynthesis